MATNLIFVAGELCSITDLFGHAQHLEFGVVPQLIIDVARQVYASYPTVKYYAYGTYFGATHTLRRFKRKFEFNPHRVSWELKSEVQAVAATSPVKTCIS